jgi:hypothetical protein
MRNFKITAEFISRVDKELDRLIRKGFTFGYWEEELEDIMKKPGKGKIKDLSLWLSGAKTFGKDDMTDFFFKQDEVMRYLNNNFEEWFEFSVDPKTGKQSEDQLQSGSTLLFDRLVKHPKYNKKMKDLQDRLIKSASGPSNKFKKVL